MGTLIASRVFEKRATEKSSWDGRIGKAELLFSSESDIVVTLDGQKLPPTSVNHFIHFALQSLQDAYAGAESLTEAIAAFDKKRTRLLEGTLGVREGGVPDDVAIGREFAQAAFIKKHGEDAWKALDEAAQVAKADEILSKNADHFAALVKSEIERRRKLAEARKAAAAEKAALAAQVAAEETLDI